MNTLTIVSSSDTSFPEKAEEIEGGRQVPAIHLPRRAHPVRLKPQRHGDLAP